MDRTKVDGLEINLKKLDSKSDITDFISTIKEKFTKDLLIFVSVPAKNEILAKYYDFKALSKHTDYFLLQTAFLGASKNVTFHPSLLSGLWDAQNTVRFFLTLLKGQFLNGPSLKCVTKVKGITNLTINQIQKSNYRKIISFILICIFKVMCQGLQY